MDAILSIDDRLTRGPSGDHETVQVIFLYDTKKGTTVAYNACT